MDPFFYCMKNCFFLCPFDVNVVFFAVIVGGYFVKIVNWRSSVACDIGGGERPWKNSDARLVLEDGSIWKAKSFGASGTQVGEVVFNTSLTGWGYYESWDACSFFGFACMLNEWLVFFVVLCVWFSGIKKFWQILVMLASLCSWQIHILGTLA